MDELDTLKKRVRQCCFFQRWKRLVLGSLILIPLCLAVFFICWSFSGDQKLREAIAEADWLDPNWRIPELERRRALIPDEENSALVLMAAQRLMPSNWPFWLYSHAPDNHMRPKAELDR